MKDIIINSDPFSSREAKNYQHPIASREHLLSIIASQPKPPTFTQLCRLLNYDKEQQSALKARLRAMERDGQLIFNKAKQYQLAPANHLITGRVVGHRDGYGFLIPDKGGKDLFINATEMQKVLHGDVVSAIVDPRQDRRGRHETKIIDVIKGRTTPIVGRYYRDGHRGVVVPEDSKIQQDIIISEQHKLGARNGQIVVVEIIERPSKRKNAEGKIIEILGDHLEPGMEIEIALREHDLPHQWSQQVLDEVAKWPDEVTPDMYKDRVDLRHLPLVTIDGADARDFDDAVYCERKKSGGWRLWVAIADVSFYVRPGSKLDEEAYERGNSVYFPSQVIPMLPEKLSNGLCSLNPQVERLCFVCEMTVSETGKLTRSKFYSAVMKSHARYTYNEVAALLTDEQVPNEQQQMLLPHLRELQSLYFALDKARKERGAIEFETVETAFVFNEQRKIERIETVERNQAHKIIEECMILANVATAKYLEKHKLPALYRVHDKPSAEKFQHFVNYLAELGIKVPFHEDLTAADYGIVLEKIAQRPDKELIQTMLLRTMRQAVYQPENIGHFGLALPAYSHFTSPIRRYPDLIAHRVIKAALEAEQSSTAHLGCYSYPESTMVEMGEHCSMTERRADDATRDVADWLKCEYMQDHVGDTFTGVISTVTSFGFFVRLQDIYTEGLVHISALTKDYYQFDEAHLCLVGERTGKRFHLGDILDVKVAAVNLDEKKIDLILADDEKVITKAKKSVRKNLANREAKNQQREKTRGEQKRSAQKSANSVNVKTKEKAPAKAKKKKATTTTVKKSKPKTKKSAKRKAKVGKV